MSEYTPSTEQVRQFWASDGNFQPAAKSYDSYESLLEFDRWLNQVKAEAAFSALGRFAATIDEFGPHADVLGDLLEFMDQYNNFGKRDIQDNNFWAIPETEATDE